MTTDPEMIETRPAPVDPALWLNSIVRLAARPFVVLTFTHEGRTFDGPPVTVPSYRLSTREHYKGEAIAFARYLLEEARHDEDRPIRLSGARVYVGSVCVHRETASG